MLDHLNNRVNNPNMFHSKGGAKKKTRNRVKKSRKNKTRRFYGKTLKRVKASYPSSHAKRK